MFRKLTKIASPFVPTAFALAYPAAAIAAQLVPTELSGNPDIISIIQAIIKFILLVAFVLAFVMLLIGGIRWIVAGGDEKAVSGARNTITAALIGLVIVLVSFALIKLVEIFFNVTIISGDITPVSIEN